tara:strand:+ start:467 stop:682 length:216 start_codon:yes stop_codon:yes gene_type:complete
MTTETELKIAKKLIKKLNKENEKLKVKLEHSIKVNEELRKENNELIPDLQAKNMLQFQEIQKLKEQLDSVK